MEGPLSITDKPTNIVQRVEILVSYWIPPPTKKDGDDIFEVMSNLHVQGCARPEDPS